MKNEIENLDTYFRRADDPLEIWYGKVAKGILVNELESWIVVLGNWKSFVTLTFRDETPPDKAWKRFRSLIRLLNKNLLGSHYTRYVKHSYFSYVVGLEYQRRGVVHFHFMVDEPIDFLTLHRIWNYWAGFAKTEIIRDVREVTRYVSKYVLKGGEIHTYKKHRNWIPDPKPYWWLGSENNGTETYRFGEGLLDGGSPELAT